MHAGRVLTVNTTVQQTANLLFSKHTVFKPYQDPCNTPCNRQVNRTNYEQKIQTYIRTLPIPGQRSRRPYWIFSDRSITPTCQATLSITIVFGKAILKLLMPKPPFALDNTRSTTMLVHMCAGRPYSKKKDLVRFQVQCCTTEQHEEVI